MIQKRSTTPIPQNRRQAFIKIACFAVFVALALLCITLLRNNHPASGAGSTLTMSKNSESTATTFGGTPIIEACNIITTDELRSKGIILESNEYPNILTRSYIEPDLESSRLQSHTEPFDTSRLSDIPNSCNYRLEARGHFFNVAVYQPPYKSAKALDAEITNGYTPEPGMLGLQVYKEKPVKNEYWDNKDNENFIIKKDDTAVWFRLHGFKQSVRQDVLQHVAKRLLQLLQHPEARVSVDYHDSPLHGQTYLACDLLTAQDISTFFGQAATPFVHEGFAGNPSRQGNTSFTTQRCTRHIRDNSNVSIDLRQFPTPQQAQEFLRASKEDYNKAQGPWQKAASTVGDETYIEADDRGSVYAADDIIHVRKGAIVLDFSYNDKAGGRTNNLPGTETLQRLTPLITSTLERVK